MKTRSQPNKACQFLAGISAFLLVTVGANAGIIFQADFLGTGGGTGGSNDLVTIGGTGAIVADGINVKVLVTNANPLIPGATNNYLEVRRLTTTPGTGTYNAVNFNFNSDGNSWLAWQGPDNLLVTNSNGDNDSVFHGAFDVFFRVNSSSGGSDDITAFRPLDSIGGSNGGTNGLTISQWGQTAAYITTGVRAAPAVDENNFINPAFVNFTDVLGGYSDGIAQLYESITFPGNGPILAGFTYHLAFTLNTDTNGLTTMNTYLVNGGGAIDPASSADLLGSITFEADASVIQTAFTNLPWQFGGTWGSPGPCVIDYASPRLYDSVPASFASLPTAVKAPPSGVVFSADFDGTNSGTGGTTNVVTVGGIGTINNNANFTNEITGALPLGAGGGNYEDVTFKGTSANYVHYNTFTPASVNNSWGSMVGPIVTNGANHYLSLNGGFDEFVRLNAIDTNNLGTGAGRSAEMISTIYYDQTSVGGLKIVWQGQAFGAMRINLQTPGTGAMQNYTNIYQSSGGNAYINNNQILVTGPTDTFGTNSTSPGATWHIGFTFKTDTNGVVTMSEWQRPDALAIDTTTTNSLGGQVAFTINANIVTNAAPLGIGGPWTLDGYANPGTDLSVDGVRVHAGSVNTFAALGIAAPPGFLPPVLSGGNITLSWTNSGLLLWSTNVLGPWTTNMSATSSPYSEPIVPSQNRFYRLKGQ